MKNTTVLGLLASFAMLATGCEVSLTPARVYVPPPEVEVTVGVPDSYVWDGDEYVGMVGGEYMYLGPGGGWLVCDSYHLDRFHGWERGHPDWRRSAVRNSGSHARGRAVARKSEKSEDHR